MSTTPKWTIEVARRLNALDYWKDGVRFEVQSGELYVTDPLESGEFASWHIPEGHYRTWLDS